MAGSRRLWQQLQREPTTPVGRFFDKTGLFGEDHEPAVLSDLVHRDVRIWLVRARRRGLSYLFSALSAFSARA